MGLLDGLVSKAVDFVMPKSTSVSSVGSLPEYTITIACPGLGITVDAMMPESFQLSTSAQYQSVFTDLLDKVPGSDTVKKAGSAFGYSLTTKILSAKVWQGASDTTFTLDLIFQAERDEIKEVIEPITKLHLLTVPRTDFDGGLLKAPGPHLKASALNDTMGSVFDSIGSVGGAALGGATDVAKNWWNGSSNLKDIASAGASKFIGTLKDSITGLSNSIGSNIVNQVSLQIGRFLLFDSVIIRDVSVTYALQPVGKGYGVSSGNMQRAAVSVQFETFFNLTADDIGKIWINPEARAMAMALVAEVKIRDKVLS